MNYAQAILDQTIYIQRKNDRLHRCDKMDYQQFCEAIDELVPQGMMNMNDDGLLLSTRESHKALAGLIQEESGKSYYDIYLSIKYDTPL